MHNHHNREITIKKENLIKKITENKQKHVKDYNEAVIAYKAEAQKQLSKCHNDLDNGSLKISLNLITPINRENEYDKIIEMFNWEISDEIKITQKEFNEYVHDDNEESRYAFITNASYR